MSKTTYRAGNRYYESEEVKSTGAYPHTVSQTKEYIVDGDNHTPKEMNTRYDPESKIDKTAFTRFTVNNAYNSKKYVQVEMVEVAKNRTKTIAMSLDKQQAQNIITFMQSLVDCLPE